MLLESIGSSTAKSKDPQIVSVTISPLPRPMPEGMSDPMPTVMASLADGTLKRLFTYYPDEVSFTADEFVGLTVVEAIALFHRKDIAYLQS